MEYIAFLLSTATPPVSRWSIPPHSVTSTTLLCTQLPASLNTGFSAHSCHNLLWPMSIPPTSNQQD